jgi:hypothetical protein
MRGAVHRTGDGRCVVPEALRTGNALERMRGLLGRPPLRPGQGLLIDPCAAVHMFGMGYAIDVAFLARDGRIEKLVPGLAPWHVASCRGARMTLELPAGAIAAAGLAPGQVLAWRGP